jgi:iron-sulfur cluster assembly protein
VPDTSIAGGVLVSQQDQRFAWTPSQLSRSAKKGTEEEVASFSLPEREAQKSHPVAAREAQPTTAQTSPAITTTASSQATSKPRKSRLRPRKAAITLTTTAVDQLRELLDDPEPKLIRVGVKNKGCSGSAYHLEYVDSPGKFDEQVVQDGVKVLIDSKALLKVLGSEMDWVEDKLSARFVFRNPNVSKSSHASLQYYEGNMLTCTPAEQCGCGESFSVS